MPRFVFNKLVRDGIVADQLEQGATPEYHTLRPDEHRTALIHKLVEEALELLAASEEDATKELADIKQVYDDLKKLLDIPDTAIEAAQRQRFDQMGGFEKGIFIDSLETPDDYPWNDYYRKNADRYPEID